MKRLLFTVLFGLMLLAGPAAAKAKRKVHHHQAYYGDADRPHMRGSVRVGGGFGAGTYARAPRMNANLVLWWNILGLTDLIVAVAAGPSFAEMSPARS